MRLSDDSSPREFAVMIDKESERHIARRLIAGGEDSVIVGHNCHQTPALSADSSFHVPKPKYVRLRVIRRRDSEECGRNSKRRSVARQSPCVPFEFLVMEYRF